MTKQKAYVQFSKRIVLLVTTAVTVISLLAVVLCFFRSDTEALISTVRTYINYATIVFAAYKIGRASCREKCRSRWSPYH